MKAKNLSLMSKGFAIVVVLLAFLWLNKTAGESIMIGGFIVSTFLPVDISLIKQAGK